MNTIGTYLLFVRDSEVPLKIGNMIRALQKEGMIGQMKASGLLVWAHTIRGAINPKIRPEVRHIWKHLTRGFPHTEDARHRLYELTGTMCDISRIGEYPDGFSPEVK